jgi:hypothetical protein
VSITKTDLPPLRVVGKKGLRITTDAWGPRVSDYYTGPDVGALVGRIVRIRLDDTPGRVFMFDPDTNEYLGKAESLKVLEQSHKTV